jgi:hypothetical protein
MREPSPEQLRTMDVRQLRDNFDMGIHEAARLRLIQITKDNIENVTDDATKVVLRNLLELITGRK